MRERAPLAAFTRLLRAQTVSTRAAEQDAHTARLVHDARKAESAKAGQLAEDAVADWMRRISAGALDPVILNALAMRVLQADTALLEARDAAQLAEQVRSKSARRLMQQNRLMKSLRARRRALRRRLTQRREDAALTFALERIAFLRSDR